MRPLLNMNMNMHMKTFPGVICLCLLLASSLLAQDGDRNGQGIPESLLLDQQTVWIESNEFLQGIGLISRHPGDLNRNRTIIHQRGEGNDALIEQIGSNSAIVLQGGSSPGDNDGNRLNLSQSGNDNSSIIAQFGSSNEVLQNVRGDNNRISILQHGATGNGKRGQDPGIYEINANGMVEPGGQNRVTQNVEGDNTRILLMQSGQGNVITQDVRGDNLEYVIEQVGNRNMISHSEDGTSFNKELQIYQNANGMDIIIQQGTFNNLKQK